MAAKTWLIIGFTLVEYTFLFSQNLVPNPSFEDTLNCPNGLDQVYNSPPWFNPTKNSPDYFNNCGSVGVPNNFIGYQLARTGVAYCGVACGGYTFSPDNRREYIEVILLDSLEVGRKYCIDFYVSLSDSSIWAIDFIGAYLSNDSIYNYSFNYLDTLPYVPQIENPVNNIITDKQNWTKISGEYIAGGGEKFITIGNFRGASTIHADTLNGTWYEAYYYIDDVSVYLCDTTINTADTIFIPNAFSPNGDGENDVFKVNGSVDELHCSIFNRWGEEVAILTKPQEGWDGTANGKKCSAGVYFYVLTAKDKSGKEITKKGNVTLLR